MNLGSMLGARQSAGQSFSVDELRLATQSVEGLTARTAEEGSSTESETRNLPILPDAASRSSTSPGHAAAAAAEEDALEGSGRSSARATRFT